MHKRLTVFLLLSTAAYASKPEPIYQDAVLREFHTEQHGTRCSSSGTTTGSVRATTNGDYTSGTINAQTNTSGSCSPVTVGYYTVALGEHVFVLTPSHSGGKKAAMAATTIVTFGLAAIAWQALLKANVLYGVLPGSVVQMRSDDGTVYIKIKKRESQYKIVSVQ